MKNQTETNFEVIFVNNNKKNNDTENKIKNMINDEFKFYIIHEPNVGVSNARNKGLSKIKEGWLLFVDVDDYISENYIEEWNLLTLNKKHIYKPYYSYIKNGKEFLETSHKIIEMSFNVGFIFYWNSKNMKPFDEKISFNETLDFILSNKINENKTIFMNSIYKYYLQTDKKYEDTSEYLNKKHKNIKIINYL